MARTAISTAVELPAVTWRVTQWRCTEDHRWALAAVSDHPGGDWRSALAVAREWGRYLIDDIEAGRLRIKVDPVTAGGGVLPGVVASARESAPG